MEILKIINRDMSLGLDNGEYSPPVQYLQPKAEIIHHEKIKPYSVTPQSFTPQELDFWQQYGITADILKLYKVSSLRTFESENKDGKQASELKQQKESELGETQAALKEVKGQLKTEKLKSTAAEVGSNIIEGIGAVIGKSKVKRQQEEIDGLKYENETIKAEMGKEIKQLKEQIRTTEADHTKITDSLRQEIKEVYDWFPDTPQLIKMGKYCRSVGFPDYMVKDLVNMKPVYFSGELRSSEFSQKFETNKSVAQLEKDPKNPGLFNLLIDKINIIEWFRQKYREFQEKIGINIPERVAQQGKSFKM